MTTSSSAIQAHHPWRYWMVLGVTFGYFALADWLMYVVFGAWPFYMVLTALFFVIQWWLLIPHPDAIRWIISSISVFIINALFIGSWFDPLLFTELAELHQTSLSWLTNTGLFIIHKVIVNGLLGFMVGCIQAISLPAPYRRRWWIIGSTIAYGLTGLRLLLFLS
jgi:hypothetical protein